jgi:hypothetical protein
MGALVVELGLAKNNNQAAMRLRLTKVDEYQLLTCIQHNLWGSKAARFSQWKPGDLLAVIVEHKLAALGTVEGKPFVSRSVVWDNGVFPHRIKVNFTHFIEPEQRTPVLGQVRDVLTGQWGPYYGWGILNQRLLEGADARFLAQAITNKRNSLSQAKRELEDLLARAKAARRETPAKKGRRKKARARRAAGTRPSRKISTAVVREEPPSTAGESSLHTTAQSELVQLGRLVGCSVWVASNDQSKRHEGRPITEGCLKSLPGMGLSEEATRRISLIDVLWLQHKAPVAAFEIEASTSIYSGLLRMADLLAVTPALNIKIYIVAPRIRRDKVMSELGRPTFRKIGLDDYCRFISTEALGDLVKKARGIGGHMQPSVLDSIAEALEEEDDQDF